jgi:hypothetical protein
VDSEPQTFAKLAATEALVLLVVAIWAISANMSLAMS